MGAPLFMPPTLRSRVEVYDVVPTSTRQADLEHVVLAPAREHPPRFRARRTRRGARRADALMGWIGLAIAVSVGCYALPYARSAGDAASPVTAWVAGVVTTLALGLCALFVVLAHHELRRWWRPMSGLATTALLGLVFLHLG